MNLWADTDWWVVGRTLFYFGALLFGGVLVITIGILAVGFWRMRKDFRRL